jgi:glutamate/aspartate transport system substrate-binding protein
MRAAEQDPVDPVGGPDVGVSSTGQGDELPAEGQVLDHEVAPGKHGRAEGRQEGYEEAKHGSPIGGMPHQPATNPPMASGNTYNSWRPRWPTGHLTDGRPHHTRSECMPPRLLVAAIACCLTVMPAAAQELTGTLKKVKESGTITLGHRESSIPFSYYDDKQQVIGYSHEIMLAAVEAVKQELKLKSLQVKLNPVTSQNRIPLIQNGTIDIECGSTTNNLERQKQVSFSNTIFVIGTRLLTRKDSGIKDFADLAGKNVVTTAGTTSERLIRKMNEEKKLGMSVISAKDHGESFLTLETGRAVAFMMDDALLYGELAKAKKPGDWVVTGTPQSREAYGCMLRKDDAPFKQVVDGAIARLMASGHAEKIYAKWFMNPVPPKGLNLDFPLSDDMKALYKSPNDKAIE